MACRFFPYLLPWALGWALNLYSWHFGQLWVSVLTPVAHFLRSAYKHKNLGDGLMIDLFSKAIGLSPPPGSMISSAMGLWQGLQYQAWITSHGTGLKCKQKVIGNPHNYCLVGCYDTMQFLLPGEPIKSILFFITNEMAFLQCNPDWYFSVCMYGWGYCSVIECLLSMYEDNEDNISVTSNKTSTGGLIDCANVLFYVAGSFHTS